MSVNVFLTNGGTWVVPPNLNITKPNTVTCIGAGGASGAGIPGVVGGGGGGGGAFARVNNIPLSPGQSIEYNANDTQGAWFQGAQAAPTVKAAHGMAGDTDGYGIGGQPGKAVDSIGTIRNDGGLGGHGRVIGFQPPFLTGGGGGGAGGPSGVGAPGGNGAGALENAVVGGGGGGSNGGTRGHDGDVDDPQLGALRGNGGLPNGGQGGSASTGFRGDSDLLFGEGVGTGGGGGGGAGAFASVIPTRDGRGGLFGGGSGGQTKPEYVVAGASGLVWIVYSPVITIQPPALNAGVEDIEYFVQLSALGGTGPYTWYLVSGDLPDGLQLNGTTGSISGTPEAAGSYEFVIQAVDANGDDGQIAYTLPVLSSPYFRWSNVPKVIWEARSPTVKRFEYFDFSPVLKPGEWIDGTTVIPEIKVVVVSGNDISPETIIFGGPGTSEQMGVHSPIIRQMFWKGRSGVTYGVTCRALTNNGQYVEMFAFAVIVGGGVARALGPGGQ